MRDTGGTIYSRSDTSFTAAPVTQTKRCTFHLSIYYSMYYLLLHLFLHVLFTTPLLTHSSIWTRLCVRWLWLDELQNQDVSDDILSRGTKCIEADVKALHLESCSAGGQRHMAACSMCQHLGSLSTTFHPHSIHCPSNEPINLGLDRTPW